MKSISSNSAGVLCSTRAKMRPIEQIVRDKYMHILNTYLLKRSKFDLLKRTKNPQTEEEKTEHFMSNVRRPYMRLSYVLTSTTNH